MYFIICINQKFNKCVYLVSSSLGGLSFGYDTETEKYGYWKKEADSEEFVPFSNGFSGFIGCAWGEDVGSSSMYSTGLFVMNTKTNEGFKIHAYQKTNSSPFSDGSSCSITSPAAAYGGTITLNIHGTHKIYFQTSQGVWDDGTEFTDTYNFKASTTATDKTAKIFKVY